MKHLARGTATSLAMTALAGMATAEGSPSGSDPASHPAWVNLKLFEPGPFYTLIGFGSMTWHGLTINQDTYNELPPEVQEVLLEVAADHEQQTGNVNASEYNRLVEELHGLNTVNEISSEVRKAWAGSLADWPQNLADDLNGQGLPATQVLNLVLDRAEANGYEWPVRYMIK